MKVKIHGPNLRDQSKGQFHVHEASCQDNGKVAYMFGGDGGWEIEAESKADATEAVYECQLMEGANYASCRDDLYFMPCCDGLPEGEPSKGYPEEVYA